MPKYTIQIVDYMSFVSFNEIYRPIGPIYQVSATDDASAAIMAQSAFGYDELELTRGPIGSVYRFANGDAVFTIETIAGRFAVLVKSIPENTL